MINYKDEPQILTVACKLAATLEKMQDFENLSLVFATTCNYINASVNPKYVSATKIQKIAYKSAKQLSGMQANHIVRACARVAANRKLGQVKEYKPGSVLYDARTFCLASDLSVASLTVLGKRITVGLVLGTYQREMLDMSKNTPSSATLVKNGNDWYLHVQVKHAARVDEPKIINNDNYLGIDLGRKDIASLSDGKSFSGEEIEKVRVKYSKIRALVTT